VSLRVFTSIPFLCRRAAAVTPSSSTIWWFH
jgi:hypothetical protein